MSDIDLRTRLLVNERVGRLQEKAMKEAEQTHRLAAILAQRTVAYYRELVNLELPSDLVNSLVLAYHEHQLGRVTATQDDVGFFVPVANSSSDG